jgi:hypothetical protein
MRIEMSAFGAADNRYSLTLPIMMGRAAAPAYMRSEDAAAHRTWLVTMFEPARTVHLVIRLSTAGQDGGKP